MFEISFRGHFPRELSGAAGRARMRGKPRSMSMNVAHRRSGDIPVAIHWQGEDVVDRGPNLNSFICVDLTHQLNKYVASESAAFRCSSRCLATGCADARKSSGVAGGRIATGSPSTHSSRGVMTAIPADAAARVELECQEPQ
jgi:hypothetical protein